ncbi:MAG: hypothetical protein ACOCUO_03660 [archaeon]
MADDRRGRDKQARNAENRQRAREIIEALERDDEVEPPVEPTELQALETALQGVDFPATGAEIVTVIGDREIEPAEGTYAVEALIPNTDEEEFEDPETVRMRIQRPTIATAMKRILEASRTPEGKLSGSQWEAYEKTLRALKAIDADDKDEGIEVITDWIIEQIREKGKLPGSRGVRRQAAKFCRANGYEIRNDEWLGV